MSLLNNIIEKKREKIGIQKQKFPLADLRKEIKNSESESRFLEMLRESELEIKLIGEIKRSSPSRGEILNAHRDILEIASIYKAHGIIAFSILTEEDFFSGNLEDLKKVKQKFNLPVLRKDFIIEEYQIYESKYYGSDAILLIVRLLDFSELERFSSLAQELHMNILYEIHTPEDLEKLLPLKPEMIGINNRDLNSLEIDLNTSATLLPLIPESIFKISESGIRSHEDIIFLKTLGADAFLIGESILTAPDPGEKIISLLGYG